MKHVIAVLVDNKPGVLVRIAGLFSRRGYNIDSLAVGPAESKDHSRITLVVHGDEGIVEQITKQFNKLPDVRKVIDMTDQPHLEREMVLFRVHVTTKNRQEVIALIETFRARILDISESSIIIEITGNTEKILSFESLLSKYGIAEVVRTGKIALSRGKK